MSMLQELIDLSSFDLISTDGIDELIFYWPEIEPFSVNFESSGVESVNFLQNIGFVLYIIYTHAFLVLVHACIHKIKRKGCLLQRLDTKLDTYLYWDGLNRFYMELFFDSWYLWYLIWNGFFDLMLYTILNLN